MLTVDEEHQWHVLDFFFDNQGDSALTIVVNGVCFHILANTTKLDADTKAGAEYHNMLSGLRNTPTEDPVSSHCPKDIDSDSGVDVRESNRDSGQEEEKSRYSYDVEATLKTWMVAPLVDSFDELAPSDGSSESKTLQDWYRFSTQFCELVVSDGGKEIQAIELDITSTLEERIQKLIPQAVLPKYISDKLNVPIYSAGELLVLDSSDQPTGTPYHPCKVQHSKSKEIHFLKIVDNAQPKATKREIDVLRRVNDLGLYKQFHVPLLEGLVVFDSAENTSSGKRRFMGFLQTEISNPTPLTLLLRNEISQKKRHAWASEVNRVKDLLHEHNIVWGDAKADNFVVDEKDRLWIIDFGGGFTDGWVDEQLHETKEGDDMGTQKIVDALKNPPEEEHVHRNDSVDRKRSETSNGGMKRRRKEDVVSNGEDNEREAKSRKHG